MGRRFEPDGAYEIPALCAGISWFRHGLEPVVRWAHAAGNERFIESVVRAVGTDGAYEIPALGAGIVWFRHGLEPIVRWAHAAHRSPLNQRVAPCAVQGGEPAGSRK